MYKTTNITLTCKVCGFQWKQRYEGRRPAQCKNCGKKCWEWGSNIRCRICQSVVIMTPDIHYVDGNRDNNQLTNKIPLCKRCHKKLHMGFSSANTYSNSGISSVRVIDSDFLNCPKTLWRLQKYHKLYLAGKNRNI